MILLVDVVGRPYVHATTQGASMREIVDFGIRQSSSFRLFRDFDSLKCSGIAGNMSNSLIISTLGQSEQPWTEYFDNFLNRFHHAIEICLMSRSFRGCDKIACVRAQMDSRRVHSDAHD